MVQGNYEIEFEGETTLSNEAKELSEKEFPEQRDDNEIYPYKNINIGKDNLSAFQLYRKFHKGIIKLDPDFQREGNVWSPKQKSELIESIIIGIPLPILYVKENKSGEWFIIDGRQRLSTIFDFMDNKFQLSNLTILKNMNGFKFSNRIDSDNNSKNLVLSNIERGKIEDVNLTLHIIKEPTPEKLTYDLFDRVNRGGTRLNNQEMRNAIYQGSSTSFLKVLSKLKSFKRATSNISSNRMKDRYLILRFVAFYLWKKKISIDFESKEDSKLIDYKSDLEDFLAKSMVFLNTLRFDIIDKEFNNLTFSEESKNYVTENDKLPVITNADSLYIKLLTSFDESMSNIFHEFRDNSFRLPKKDGGVKRPINMSLFEVATYYFIELRKEYENNRKLIREEYINLITNKDYKRTRLEEDDFVKSLTYIVDSNKSVYRRFNIIDSKIQYIKENVEENKN
ncbi:MAG: DUF262 domain-containing protein [Christiangramia sp.]